MGQLMTPFLLSFVDFSFFNIEMINYYLQTAFIMQTELNIRD